MILLLSCFLIITTCNANNFRKLNVFGADNRESVPDNSMAPYSAVGKLVFSDDSFCTATLVSPNYILTAGSCIYENRVQKSKTEGMLFYPAHNSTFNNAAAAITSILGETKVPETRVGLNYVLLKLDIDYGNVYGYIPIADYEREGVIPPESRDIMLIQYADDNIYSASPAIQNDVRVFYNPNLEAEFSNLIIHDGDTAIRGSIGAPLLQLGPDSALVLIGIHTGGTTESSITDASVDFNLIDSFTLERSNTR